MNRKSERSNELSNELSDSLYNMLNNLNIGTNVSIPAKRSYNDMSGAFICEIQHSLQNGLIAHLLNGGKTIKEYYEYIIYTYPEKIIYSFSLNADIISEISYPLDPANILNGTFKLVGKYEVMFYPAAFDCMAHLESVFMFNKVPYYIRDYPIFADYKNLSALYNCESCIVTTIDRSSTTEQEVVANSRIDIQSDSVFKLL